MVAKQHIELFASSINEAVISGKAAAYVGSQLYCEENLPGASSTLTSKRSSVTWLLLCASGFRSRLQ
ncbi:hypothetical protein [Paenibacillus sp. SI8]|uniref:hypothetical protein n=1 Tax=unclassified Paenibacillus TaxID=185978 RepID=UPI0034654CAB